MIAFRRWPPGFRRFLLTTPLGRLALIVPRLCFAVWHSRALHRFWSAVVWAFRSRDVVPRSYQATPLSQDELCWTVAVITGQPVGTIMAYRDEIIGDRDLADYVRRTVQASAEVWSYDPGFQLGRRLALYLLARALRPARIIEAGVDRGYGAVILMRALERNAADGAPGEYLGVDAKGVDDAFLYTAYPRRVGSVERGDAVEFIRRQSGQGALILHDTTTESAHVDAFCAALDSILAEDTVIVSTWTLPQIMALAVRRQRRLLTHQDAVSAFWGSVNRISILFPSEKGGPPVL